ncbi:MAG: nicotinate-nicotinamide nucleotide adenylyltransferase [Alphaproteobacteria bacterium]|nr:nicotinate-nicotinamide nucleotide adenylyltransferase [Alphaproteobacteria bacterium]
MRLAPGLRVGLYGGSFDPLHEGHSHVAQEALRRLRLDRLVWLVSPANPLKVRAGSRPEDLAIRLAKVRAALRGASGTASGLEARLNSAYTLDLIRWLKARFPAVAFVWIMGADSLETFHRWNGWQDLAREIPIAVVSRDGAMISSRVSPMARRFAFARRPLDQAAALARARPPAWLYIPAPLHRISSTALRRRRPEIGA